MAENPSKIPATKPPVPWKTKVLASAATLMMNVAIYRRKNSVNRCLLSLLEPKAGPSAKPVNGVATSDHTVDPARHLWVRLFSPSNEVEDEDEAQAQLPVVVYFHGGGFVFHSAATAQFDALCRRLSRHLPALVVSVDYRLAPENRHPAAYDDGLDVLRWLDTGNLITDLSAVFLAGDSAGGNIAHHVARRAAAEPFKRLALAGLVGFQPFFGGKDRTESEERLDGRVLYGSMKMFELMWRSFLPVGSDLDHEAANVFGPGSKAGSEDWTGFPATMVIIGGWDTLQDRQRMYVEGLRGVGVQACVAEYPNAIHGFYAFDEMPDADRVIADVGEFVRRRAEEQRSGR